MGVSILSDLTALPCEELTAYETTMQKPQTNGLEHHKRCASVEAKLACQLFRTLSGCRISSRDTGN